MNGDSVSLELGDRKGGRGEGGLEAKGVPKEDGLINPSGDKPPTFDLFSPVGNKYNA